MRLAKIYVLVTGLGFSLVSFSLHAQTIKEAIQQTIQSNPDILMNIQTWLASQKTIGEAQGNAFPKIDVVAEYGREHTSRNLAITGPEEDFRTFMTKQGVGITIRQILFDGFYTQNEVDRTANHTIADAYKAQGIADDIALMAVKSYLDVLRTKKIVELAKQNFVAHKRIYEMIKQRSQKGLGREADTVQAYGRLALAKANLLATESNYKGATATYEKIVGKAPQQLMLPIPPSETSLPLTEAAAIQDAIDFHPTIKSANADVKEARSQYKVSQAANMPTVSALVTVSKYHNTGGTPGRNNDYIAGVQMNYNLFNGGTDKARQEETAILVNKAQETANRTYNQIVESMKLSWNAWKTTQKQLSYFSEHQAASEKAVKSYREQFLLGKRTLLDLLDSESELFTSQTDYLNGQYLLIFAKYRILNSEGRLLPYFGISIPELSNLNISLPPAFPPNSVKPVKTKPGRIIQKRVSSITSHEKSKKAAYHAKKEI